jgi:protein-disulfide isomerase
MPTGVPPVDQSPSAPPRRRRWWPWLVGAATLPFVAFAAYVLWLVPRIPEGGFPSGFTTVPGGSTGPAGGGALVRPWSPSSGPADAAVTIVEFSDFECPYCQASFPVIRSIVAMYPGRIRFVYRHFPIAALHDRATAAAEASACAAAEGKFWPYHDRLFQRRQFDDASLRRYALESGLDVERFDGCLTSRQFQSDVARDVSDGQALGVRGTPTWFINGRKVEGAIPESTFRDVVRRLLGESR